MRRPENTKGLNGAKWCSSLHFFSFILLIESTEHLQSARHILDIGIDVPALRLLIAQQTWVDLWREKHHRVKLGKIKRVQGTHHSGRNAESQVLEPGIWMKSDRETEAPIWDQSGRSVRIRQPFLEDSQAMIPGRQMIYI